MCVYNKKKKKIFNKPLEAHKSNNTVKGTMINVPSRAKLMIPGP